MDGDFLPAVSVVIPVYNSSRFLHTCFDSLLEQSFSDFELVCVNDGSTDDSLKILNEYAAKDPRVRIVTKQNEGGGAASARNLGLSLAEGTYVQFLDSDDFFEPDMLTCLVEKAQRTNADVVLCGADRYDQRLGRVVSAYEHLNLELAPAKAFFSYRDCPDRIFQLGNVLAWNRLYRRNFLLEHKLYFELIPISDDLYLPALALVLAERLAVVDKPFIHYRFNTGSSQVDSIPKHPEAGYAANASIVAKMQEYGVYETVKLSWLDVSLRMMRAYFDQMTELQNMKQLYEIYRGKILPMLGAENLTREDFYDYRLWEWYQMLTSYSLEELLFLTARGYGAKSTTAILRFSVPYDTLQQGDKIVLVGKGLIGRYWYAQLLLSEYCEVVYWADVGEQIPDIAYDTILEAK